MGDPDRGARSAGPTTPDRRDAPRKARAATSSVSPRTRAWAGIRASWADRSSSCSPPRAASGPPTDDPSPSAITLTTLGGLPFAGFCSDPCDGRTQGTPGMMDSLAYRNDAAVVLQRLARSLPTRKGVLGVATCDKGLPAMMMALAGLRDLPCVLVPGGVTLPPRDGEDVGTVRAIGARFAHGELTLERVAELGCRACGSPGRGCQFLGTAATSQVVGEALGLSLPHSALAPSGQPIWLDMARRSARALVSLEARGLAIRDVVTEAAVRNAMMVHAAFGRSTNLLVDLTAVAYDVDALVARLSHPAGGRGPTTG